MLPVDATWKVRGSRKLKQTYGEHQVSLSSLDISLKTTNVNLIVELKDKSGSYGSKMRDLYSSSAKSHV